MNMNCTEILGFQWFLLILFFLGGMIVKGVSLIEDAKHMIFIDYDYEQDCLVALIALTNTQYNGNIQGAQCRSKKDDGRFP